MTSVLLTLFVSGAYHVVGDLVRRVSHVPAVFVGYDGHVDFLQGVRRLLPFAQSSPSDHGALRSHVGRVSCSAEKHNLVSSRRFVAIATWYPWYTCRFLYVNRHAHLPDLGKQATRTHGLSIGTASRSSITAMSLSNVLSRKSGCLLTLATWCTDLRPVSTFRLCSPTVMVRSLGL